MTKSSRADSVSSKKARRHNPLSDDLVATGPLRERSKKRKAKPEDEEKTYVDDKSSRKILKIGQDLADEVHEETGRPAPNPAFAFESRFRGEDDGAVHEEPDENDEVWGDDDDDAVEEDLDPNDFSLFNKFMPQTTAQDHILQPQNGQENGQVTNLADLILEKIAAHESAKNRQPVIHGGGIPDDAVELPAKVVEVYSKYESSSSHPCLQTIANTTSSGLACFSRVTSRGNSPSHLRLSQRFPNGKNCFRSQDQRLGRQTLATRPHEYSSLPSHILRSNSSKR